MGKDAEGGDDAGRAEGAAASGAKGSVVKRSPLTTRNGSSPRRPRSAARRIAPAVPRIGSSGDQATGIPSHASPTAAMSASARWWAFTTADVTPSGAQVAEEAEEDRDAEEREERLRAS